MGMQIVDGSSGMWRMWRMWRMWPFLIWKSSVNGNWWSVNIWIPKDALQRWPHVESREETPLGTTIVSTSSLDDFSCSGMWLRPTGWRLPVGEAEDSLGKCSSRVGRPTSIFGVQFRSHVHRFHQVPPQVFLPPGRVWYSACVAAWRLGIPVVPLVDDLSKPEQQRRCSGQEWPGRIGKKWESPDPGNFGSWEKKMQRKLYLFLKVLWQVYDRIIVTIVVPLQIIRCGIIVVPLVRVPQKLASFFSPYIGHAYFTGLRWVRVPFPLHPTGLGEEEMVQFQLQV